MASDPPCDACHLVWGENAEPEACMECGMRFDVQHLDEIDRLLAALETAVAQETTALRFGKQVRAELATSQMERLKLRAALDTAQRHDAHQLCFAEAEAMALVLQHEQVIDRLRAELETAGQRLRRVDDWADHLRKAGVEQGDPDGPVEIADGIDDASEREPRDYERRESEHRKGADNGE